MPISRQDDQPAGRSAGRTISRQDDQPAGREQPAFRPAKDDTGAGAGAEPQQRLAAVRAAVADLEREQEKDQAAIDAAKQRLKADETQLPAPYIFQLG
jgi:hypothetical protein